MGKGLIVRLVTLVALVWFAWQLRQGGWTKWNWSEHLSAPYQSCHPLHVAAGSEDAVIFSHDPPILWVSAADHKTLTTSHVAEGHIYQVDLTTNKSKAIPMRGLTQVFHPHGISLIDVAGSKILFVVNHQHQGQPDQVVIFEWKEEEGVLQHVETVEDKAFVSLNSVQGLTPRTFYATNDHGYPRVTPMAILSTLFAPLSKSSVVYWNGRSASFPVAPGTVRMANGIAMSPRGDRLYVADTRANSLHIYRTSAADRTVLLPETQIPLPTSPDNLRVDEDGSLYIGTVPNVLRFIWHLVDWRNHSAPAQVLRVQFVGSGQNSVLIETLYQSNGDQIATSSTGLRVGNPQSQCQRLVITPVFQERILVCPSNCNTE